MKTLISAVLALTLLGTAGASAQSWRGNGGDRFAQGSAYQDRGYQDRGYDRGNQEHGWNRGYQGGGWQGRGYENRGWHDDYRHDSRSGINNQVGLGLGLFALAAILASQNQAQHAPVYNSGYNGGYYGR